MDCGNGTQFELHHYALKVSERKLDEIFAWFLAENVPYGNVGDINHGGGYFRDPNWYLLEMLAADYITPVQ